MKWFEKLKETNELYKNIFKKEGPNNLGATLRVGELDNLITALEIAIDALNSLKNASREEEEVDSGTVYMYSNGALCEIEKLGAGDE